MGETRVNLRHLLEDIRDSYPVAQEEVIVSELVANSLDSHAQSFLGLNSSLYRDKTFNV